MPPFTFLERPRTAQSHYWLDYGLDDRGIRGSIIARVRDIFLFPMPSHRVWRLHCFLFRGFPGPRPESDHSLSSSSEVENGWNYTMIPPYAIMALPLYEGWNFKSGNYLFTTDTK